LEAKKSKNSAICAKRSEDRQSKDAGFDEPQGGYMKVESEASGHRDGCRPEREKEWWAAMSTPSSTTPDPVVFGAKELKMNPEMRLKSA